MWPLSPSKQGIDYVAYSYFRPVTVSMDIDTFMYWFLNKVYDSRDSQVNLPIYVLNFLKKRKEGEFKWNSNEILRLFVKSLWQEVTLSEFTFCGNERERWVYVSSHSGLMWPFSELRKQNKQKWGQPVLKFPDQVLVRLVELFLPSNLGVPQTVFGRTSQFWFRRPCFHPRPHVLPQESRRTPLSFDPWGPKEWSIGSLQV